jgi:hypothetical protein
MKFEDAPAPPPQWAAFAEMLSLLLSAWVIRQGKRGVWPSGMQRQPPPGGLR